MDYRTTWVHEPKSWKKNVIVFMFCECQSELGICIVWLIKLNPREFFSMGGDTNTAGIRALERYMERGLLVKSTFGWCPNEPSQIICNLWYFGPHLFAIQFFWLHYEKLPTTSYSLHIISHLFGQRVVWPIFWLANGWKNIGRGHDGMNQTYPKQFMVAMDVVSMRRGTSIMFSKNRCIKHKNGTPLCSYITTSIT
jgi:hypothetical protein